MKGMHFAMILLGLTLVVVWNGPASGTLPAPVEADQRCPVCGMMVAKYPEWIAQIELADGTVLMFDGPKDMFAYYFAPEDYGGGEATVTAVAVRDYYKQQWLDGMAALYVVGSDVLGPMGHEFVPFASREAAENFLKDHHGKRILSFEQVDLNLVQSMRKGHKMKGHMEKK